MRPSQKQAELELLLMGTEGEITPDIEELYLEILKAENFEDNLKWLLKQFEIAESLVKTRVEKLEIIKNKLESSKNQTEYWKNKISSLMTSNKTTTCRSNEYSLSFRGSQVIEITDESIIPAEYLTTTTKVITAPDKNKIKDAIKAKTVVPGTQLVEKYNLQIKI